MNESNPNDFTIKGPKVVMPPLGILDMFESDYHVAKDGRTNEIEKIRANQNQVLMSKRLSITWAHFHSVDTIPI